jgi:transcriptional regulator with XRE-family HTH domain
MTEPMTFGAYLAACREASGKTQAQVAAACAITPEAICQIERGRRKPTFDRVLALADALQIDRGLLSRFALQSRASQFYTTLGLEPVGEEALLAACPHLVVFHPLFANPQEEGQQATHGAPPAEAPRPSALGVPAEPAPPAC